MTSSDTTVIPARVRAKVSIRIVPEQDLDTIAKSLVEHVQDSFKELDSPNTLRVSLGAAGLLYIWC